MKNFVQPGNTITLTAPYAVASGDGLLVGSIFGIAAGAAAIGEPVETALVGVFDITKVGRVAGCRVTEGVVRKGARVRIIRDDVVVLELGVLNTLKRFKDEVNEVVAGQECGMNFGTFQDVKEGDFIECFTLEEIKRSL